MIVQGMNEPNEIITKIIISLIIIPVSIIIIGDTRNVQKN